MDKPLIRISVRNLVEFILRSGDLDSRSGGMDLDAMQKGSRLHRKIQKQMGSSYRPEVSLKQEREFEDLVLSVEGRADGVQEEQGQVIIDEIKGVYLDVWKMEGPIPIHRAQAMCYAYMYALQNQLEHIGVQMTYGNLDTEQLRRFQEEFTFQTLEEWYLRLTQEYHKWVSYQLQWKDTRNRSMQGLEFPFPYREGQRKVVTGVYHTIVSRKQVFVQAPTGVGKTMSTIFPAVRAIGEGLGEKVFYLTAKTITRTVAEEAFSILKEKGLQFKVITLTAKEKMCVCDQVECNPDACPYAKGHFDRINDAVYELWTQKNSYDRETLKAHADKWKVCPFEMCLDLSLWTDGVICDYNYVFDPNVHLKRFFGDDVRKDYIFLIDEAHNLVERGREMYSAVLYKEEVLEIRRKLKPFEPRNLLKALNKVNDLMLTYKRECENFVVMENCGSLPILLMNVMGELEKFLEEPPNADIHKEVLEFYFTVRDFVSISELVDDNYVIYSQMEEDGRFKIKEYCVNPATNLREYLSKSVGTVFFSATLLPLGYYKKLFSTAGDDYMIYVESPFDRENRCLLVGQDVSSRYTRRGYGEYRKIGEYIQKFTSIREGNYMVFFPSHKLLRDVYEVFERELCPSQTRCLLQQPSMDEAEREEFLEQFKEQSGTLVGFCVMGGIFAEGIDLMGDRLIGAIVVGTGIPQVSCEREILKQFYDKKGENGFDYAYRYPGMNKVLQSAGRVIRTQEDVGTILLLDDRFLTEEYRQMFPVEWADYRVCNLKNAQGVLEAFWEGR